MNSLFDFLERHKFGLIASLSVYVAIFIYLQIASFPKQIHYDPFYDGSYIEIPEEEIKLKPENILVPDEFSQDVKSIGRDVNDPRERSDEEYYQNVSDEDIESELRELEKQMYEESGGEEERKRLEEEIAKKRAALETKKQEIKKDPNKGAKGGNKTYSGNVMVEWSLREPHLNNAWYVRNPGYVCGHGSSGKVTVKIKVNSNGDVISAVYDATNSYNANDCMIKKAVEYAKKSRFKYSPNKVQSGWISYTFISQ